MALKVEEYGKTDLLRRVEASKDTEIDPLVGQYENVSAAITAAIAKQGDGSALLTLSHSLGALNYALTAIGPALWEGRATGSLPLAVLVEVRNDGFLLTSGRILRLRFDRRS